MQISLSACPPIWLTTDWFKSFFLIAFQCKFFKPSLQWISNQTFWDKRIQFNPPIWFAIDCLNLCCTRTLFWPILGWRDDNKLQFLKARKNAYNWFNNRLCRKCSSQVIFVSGGAIPIATTKFFYIRYLNQMSILFSRFCTSFVIFRPKMQFCTVLSNLRKRKIILRYVNFWWHFCFYNITCPRQFASMNSQTWWICARLKNTTFSQILNIWWTSWQW